MAAVEPRDVGNGLVEVAGGWEPQPVPCPACSAREVEVRRYERRPPGRPSGGTAVSERWEYRCTGCGAGGPATPRPSPADTT